MFDKITSFFGTTTGAAVGGGIAGVGIGVGASCGYIYVKSHQSKLSKKEAKFILEQIDALAKKGSEPDRTKGIEGLRTAMEKYRKKVLKDQAKVVLEPLIIYVDAYVTALVMLSDEGRTLLEKSLFVAVDELTKIAKSA